MTRPLSVLLPCALLLVACAPKGIEGLQTFTYPGGDQRSGSLTYAQLPPAGGPHNALWQTCGVYDQPVYNEYAVSSLARGALWITYRPGLDAAQKAALLALAKATPNTLLSPYPGQDSAIALTVWNAQVKVPTADDARVKAFVAAYAERQTAPYPGAPCSGGFGGVR